MPAFSTQVSTCELFTIQIGFPCSGAATKLVISTFTSRRQYFSAILAMVRVARINCALVWLLNVRSSFLFAEPLSLSLKSLLHVLAQTLIAS